MLISFAVENFRSYREQQVMSLLAGDDEELGANTIAIRTPALKGRRALRAVAIYGANSSGKSNFVKAIGQLTRIVEHSAKESTATEKLPVVPFRLDKEWASRPTRFTTTFLIDEILYTYELAASAIRVHREELTAFPKTHPRVLFRRNVNDAGESDWHFSKTHFKRDSDLQKRTRKNSLYVSVGAAWNHPLLTRISDFFTSTYTRQPQDADLESRITAEQCVSDPEFRKWATRLLAAADTGIADVRATTIDMFDRMPDEIKSIIPEDIAKHIHETPEVEVAHRLRNNKVKWWTIDRESDGTRQLLSLLRSWYDLSKKGGLVAIDELDDSLHPLISRQLLLLLSEKEFKAAQGQLIFTTHDTTLLDPTLLRRDQIFFAEKSRDGASRLYSLLEYTPRKQEPFQKGYLGGRYGAIPFLADFKYEPSKQTATALKEIATPTTDDRESA